jgi:regulator of sigma E protease
VFIHEWGHYLIARLSGVKIEVFSIGFGPEIFGWHDKHQTRWKVCCIPLGGYIKMFGDANAASVPDSDKLQQLTLQEQKQAFHTKPLWIKSAIAAAGPVANFILAIVILSICFSFYGKPFATSQISFIQAGSPAERAGLAKGDIILSINGQNITEFRDIERIISINPDTELKITLKRGEHHITKKVHPEIVELKDNMGNKAKIGRLGIGSSVVEYKKFNLLDSTVLATYETWNISSLILKTLGQIVTGKRSAGELSGPIFIAKYSGHSLKQGWGATLGFMVILSINLGLINLLPIPVLDGGHLLFYGIEALMGKPLAERFQHYGFRIGFVLLITLMLFSTFNDLKNLKLFK